MSATSASSGAVSYSVTSGPATISGNMVTLTGVGTVVLGASQAASGSYVASTASISFTVNPATPVVTMIAPNTGQQSQLGLLVTITGQYTHFAQGTTTASFGPGIAVASLTVNSATSATALVDIDPVATIGMTSVTVTSTAEIVTLTNGFSISAGTPAISFVSPTTAQPGLQGVSFAIAGQYTHFAQGVTTASFGSGATVTSLTVNSGVSATAVVNIDPAAVPGVRAVTMSTSTEVATLTGGFTITSGIPTLSRISPDAGLQGRQSLSVSVGGQDTHFAQGPTTVSFGAGVTVVSVTVYSNASLAAVVNIDPTTAPGSQTITVTTGSEVASLPSGFTIGLLIGLPTASPAALTVNVPATVAVSSRIKTPSAIVGSVNVELLDAQGQPQSVVGQLFDNGVAPDLIAGDGVYSGIVTLQGTQTGSLSIAISSNIQGSATPIASGLLSIDVLPAGIPTEVVTPDLSQVIVDPATGSQIIGNEVLVCFTTATSVQTIVADAGLIGAKLVGRFSGLGNCYQFGLPAGSTGAKVDVAIDTLQVRPEVVSIGPDKVVTPAGAVCYTCQGDEWGPFGLLNLQTAHTPAQDVSTASTGANSMVAVLDSGIDPYYLLSDDRIIAGPDELLGTNVSADYDGHGTFVAGIIRATAPDSQIYVVRVLDNSGEQSADSIIAKGIFDATQAGSDVINLSLGDAGHDIWEMMAVTWASLRNVVVVAAAGNDGQNTIPQSPADLPGVLSVGATDRNDLRWVGKDPSNFGDWVYIAAPGEDIASWYIPGPSSGVGNGTSLSAAFVSGIAALVRSVNPTWSVKQVISHLESTAKKLKDDAVSGADQGFVYGRVSPLQLLVLQVTGPGTVSIKDNARGSVVSCTSSSPCAQYYMGVPDVTLTADISSGATVVWGGDNGCVPGGVQTSFVLKLDKDRSCTATIVSCAAQSICGTVTDAETGTIKLVGIPIELRDSNGGIINTAYTNSSGYCTFSNLTSSSYYLDVGVAVGEVGYPAQAKATPGMQINFQVLGVPASVTVTGPGSFAWVYFSKQPIPSSGLPACGPGIGVPCPISGTAPYTFAVPNGTWWLTCYVNGTQRTSNEQFVFTPQESISTPCPP